MQSLPQALISGCLAYWSKAGTKLFRKELRLFPGREVTTFFRLVEIDEFLISPLRPTPRRSIVFAGKDAYGGGDSDVGGIIKVEVSIPIEAGRRNRCVGQPVERDVVDDIVSCQVISGMTIDRVPDHGRHDHRRRLSVTVAVVEHPGCQADGRIR